MGTVWAMRRIGLMLVGFVCAAVGMSACSPRGSSQAASGQGPACVKTVFGDKRPVKLHVPKNYVCRTAAPLVVMLHGYTSSGNGKEQYFGLNAEADKRGFLYMHPDGTKDRQGNRFWNATDACCNFYGSIVDDSAYISTLISTVKVAYNVDPKRVYLIGHSNGGFMTYRMACDHGDQIAGIASLAGAMYQDVTQCKAASTVSVLQIHGVADETISYEGGMLGRRYPSAKTTVADWASRDRCTAAPVTPGVSLDLDSGIAGSESKVTVYGGCSAGTAVQLWSVAGGAHTLDITPNVVPDIMDFFYAHPKQ